MATIIVFAQSATSHGSLFGYYAGLIGYLVFFSAMMATAPLISAWMSPIALSVSKRLMGIILAAIAFEMITGALRQVFPSWAT
jgi:multiple antibiotic resistance protein